MEYSLINVLISMVVLSILTAMVFVILTDLTTSLLRLQVDSVFEYESAQIVSTIDNFVKQAYWLNTPTTNGSELKLQKIVFDSGFPKPIDFYVGVDNRLKTVYVREGSNKRNVKNISQEIENITFSVYSDKIEVSILAKKGNFQRIYKYILTTALSQT